MTDAAPKPRMGRIGYLNVLPIYHALEIGHVPHGYELIYGPTHPGPWRSIDDLELATLSWVHWHNHRRLHGHCGDIPPAEYEKTFYATEQGEQALVEIK